jgi:diguanylate cyclase (GGDEF)-like protein
MAASDNIPVHQRPQPGGSEPLSALALDERVAEEISRAERHGTHLSCLLVVIDNIEEMIREHGSDLHEETLAYVAGALRRELRRFDRIGRPSDGELLIVLPGADGPVGEIVARRVLDRVRTIKVEARGMRRALQISVGLAAWHEDMSWQDLLARTRAATTRRNGEERPAATDAGGGAASLESLSRYPQGSHAGPRPAVEGTAPS